MRIELTKIRRALETIEKITIVNNPDEDNEVLNDIYKIAHSFAGRCHNPHSEWQELEEKIAKELRDFRPLRLKQ